MNKLRIRNIKNAKEIVSSNEYVILNPESYKNNFSTLFGNNNPIHLEIGMGKGNFLIGMAKKYPNINFIGVERYESILVRAVGKLSDEKLNNLKIICVDALNLGDIFGKEIDTIYLNFSDPWPKKRHAKRRLTSDIFLRIYDQIFKDEKKIIQKTDNILLFASSITSLSQYGYTFEEVTLDLASSDIDNVMTEYEEKFSNKGYKINYLKATKK